MKTTMRGTRRSVVLALVCAAAVTLGSGAAWATDVYLNGVKVNGMVNQQFKNAQVSFDGQGNVRIEVEGVSVQRQDPTPAGGQVVSSSARLSQQYWLISDKSAPGRTQYDIDVHINGQLVVRIKSADKDQLVMDISKHLVPGKNTINFTAIKNIGSGRVSFSAEDTFGIVIGTGQKQGNALMIDQQLASYRRTAADVANDSFEVSVEAK